MIGAILLENLDLCMSTVSYTWCIFYFSKVGKNVDTAFKTMTAISDSILQQKVPNEKNVLLRASDNLEASLRRSTSSSINESAVEFSGGNDAKIHFPTGFGSVLKVDVVDVVVNTFEVSYQFQILTL